MEMTDDTRLLDAKVFAALADGISVCGDSAEVAQNYCPDCPETPMLLHADEYKCPGCGRTESAELVGVDIRTLMGANTLGRFRGAGEYAKTQKESVLKQLKYNNETSGSKFPLDLLDEVATQYNSIQKSTEDVYDEEGTVIKTKKFVRRSNIKDEVLAALIHFECVKRGVVRKKKDIATFMKLQSNGFSSGEKILRNLFAEGKITIDIGDEPIDGFASRYFDCLGIDNESYINFVVDIIKVAEQKKIGVNSFTSSKVVGAIWILITQLRLKITVEQLESAGDNTKKNTFIKFYKEVAKNNKLFIHIFKKYGVPLLEG